MRVLRFIWRGVLAFDRVGSRIPQLIQIWLGRFRAGVLGATRHRARWHNFSGVMKDVEIGELKAQGKVIDYITEDQEEYYGFDESDFGDPSSDGRVMMLLSYP